MSDIQSIPLPTKEEMVQAHENVKPYLTETPVLTNEHLDELAGANLFFKCENFQPIGAFKVRGATNAILQLSKEQRRNGVVTHSSGNHGQAVARVAKQLGIKAYIVVPKVAPAIKKRRIEEYGAQIILSDHTTEDRERKTEQIIDETGATLIHSSADYHVIAGQGTCAKELLSQVPDLDYIYTPIGGGGIVSGTALACHYFHPSTKVVGVEPKAVDDAYRSLQAGKVLRNTNYDTVADGLKTDIHDINLKVLTNHTEGIVTVDEDEIIEAMKLLWNRLKITAEPSSSVPFAGILKHKAQLQNKRVGVIVTGGNVDISNLPF